MYGYVLATHWILLPIVACPEEVTLFSFTVLSRKNYIFALIYAYLYKKPVEILST